MATAKYRFSYPAFRRYAPLIGAALRAFPRVAPCAMPNPDSHIQGVRDAIKAKKLNPTYLHESIDDSLFAKHADALSVSASFDSEDPGLLIGPLAAIRELQGKGPRAIVALTADKEFVITDHGRALEYWLLAIQSHSIIPVPTLVVKALKPERLAELTANYPLVSLMSFPDEPGKYQII